jgi:SAM-dependent MidA family methyltransferase
MSSLPTPSAESQQHSQQLSQLVQQIISEAAGWIDFSTYMQLALYAPSLGYYTGGSQKFGSSKNGGGDFITAPEITPLFAQSLARQVSQVLQETQGSILELGAGTGRLAADLMLALADEQQLPDQYFILEVSDHLRHVQFENLREKLTIELFNKIVWLDTLPEQFVGLILGNEVLDAIPVHLVVKKQDVLYERGVVFNGQFSWQDRPLKDHKIRQLIEAMDLPNDYLTEVCPAATGLINSLANTLQHGAILMLDYGFSAREYYHPQRNQGTLMCHYQHYAHADPLINIGLQDITAHVNFTAIAEAGLANGLVLEGYTNQAQFLMACGLLDLLALESPDNVTRYVPMASSVQKLISPAEMGELFKVIALSRGLNAVLVGFKGNDKSHTL